MRGVGEEEPTELGNAVGVAEEAAPVMGGGVTVLALRGRNVLAENGIYEKRAPSCQGLPGEAQKVKAPGTEEARRTETCAGRLPTFRMLAARYLLLRQEPRFIHRRKRTKEVKDMEALGIK